MRGFVLAKTAFIERREVRQYIGSLKQLFSSEDELIKSLNSYKWPNNRNGFNFEQTWSLFQRNREMLEMEIAKKNSPEILNQCKDILRWGGVGVASSNIRRITELHDSNQLISTLIKAKKIIDSEQIDFQSVDFPVNSGFSKIYASICAKFIIYDSRVAAKMCQVIGETFSGENPIGLGKCAHNAKVSRDPGPQFPLIRSHIDYFLSNMKASWIIGQLAAEHRIIDYPIDKLILAYQTALFRMGYQVSH